MSKKICNVHLHLLSSSGCITIKANYFQSLINQVNLASRGNLEHNPDQIAIDYFSSENSFHISPRSITKLDQKWKQAVLGRPSSCPLKLLGSVNQHKLSEQLSADLINRDIRLASCLFVESIDNKVLITRRTSSMRAFPNVWVPPGGVVDPGESLQEACMRELFEEVGMSAKQLNLEHQPKLLGYFESSFPLSFQSITDLKRHTLVAYFHVKSKCPAEALNEKLNLNPSEVDRATWVCVSVLKKAFSSHGYDCGDEKLCCASKCSCHLDQLLGAEVKDKTMITNIGVDTILNKYDETDPWQERISTGTLFALQLWMNNLLNNSDVS